MPQTEKPSLDTNPLAPLVGLIQDTVLPAVEAPGGPCVVLTRRHRRDMKLPTGVAMLPRRTEGRRQAIRTADLWERAPMRLAVWPRDQLHENRVAKMALVLQGKAGFRFADYVLQCPAGTILFVPGGVPHTNGSTSHLESLGPENADCHLLWLTPMISGLNCRVCHTRGEKHYSGLPGEKAFIQNPRVLQLFNCLGEEIQEEAQNGAPLDNSRVISHLLAGLFHAVLREVSGGNCFVFARGESISAHGDLPRPGLEENGEAPLDQAIRYVKANYSRPLTLENVAARFYVSRTQLAVKFRERTGETFLQFISRCRLEQAKRLLVETEWTSAMIGNFIGFRSPAHFHRFFQRHEGRSPIAFRQAHRGSEVVSEPPVTAP